MKRKQSIRNKLILPLLLSGGMTLCFSMSPSMTAKALPADKRPIPDEQPSPTLQPVSINPGEAVLATFLEERLYKPEEWTIQDGSEIGMTMQKAYRMFHGAMFQWLKPYPDANKPEFCMERAMNVEVGGYDHLIVGAVLPDKAQLQVCAVTERGELKQTFEKLPDQQREYFLPLQGAQQLKHLRLSVFSNEQGTQSGAILWIILQNKQKLAEYQRQLLPFGTTWEKHLKPESYQPEFIPTYGIVFDKGKLEEIRNKHEEIIRQQGQSPYLQAAGQMMSQTPEELLREYVGNNIRFGRDRDLQMPDLRPSTLAIAGVLSRDKEMLRMAARHALTLAVTPHWDEGFMGHFPGSNWVHAAFRESWVAHELAITLDLAGEMLTKAGQDYILKRLATDGIGHINYITWSAEYIHRMNQMSVFSHGRILSYAVLMQTMPRVKPYLELAYTDLVNNLQKIILPDGSDVEGPSYMTYTIAEAALALYYYAQATGKPLTEVIPANILHSEQFAEALCSTVDDYDFIPICDADPNIDRMDAVAFLAAMSEHSCWNHIYTKALDRQQANAQNAEVTPLKQGIESPGLLALVIPSSLQRETFEPKPFVSLPDMGVMASTRKTGNEWLKILIQGNKAKAGHCHEDKGSFYIEFAGEVFAEDLGRAPYGDAMTFTSKQCQWHNMLIPIETKERPCPINPIPADVKPTGNGDAQHFDAQIDATPGWENYFAQHIRTWQSSTPEELTITDQYSLKQGNGVEFYWLTTLPVEMNSGMVRIKGQRGMAEIKVPKGCSCRVEKAAWWDKRQVNRILFTRKRTSGTITTHVRFTPLQ